MTIKKGILKSGAAVLGVGLIVLIVLIACYFGGNPIRKYFVGQNIRNHVEVQYSELNLKTGWVQYDYLTNRYYAQAYSEISPDTHFNVYWKKGGCVDDYETAVLNGWNTAERLGIECLAEIRPLLEQVRGLKIREPTYAYVIPDDGETFDVPIDIRYDKSAAIRYGLTLSAVSDNPSTEQVYDWIEEIYWKLKNEGYTNIVSFRITVQSLEDESVSVHKSLEASQLEPEASPYDGKKTP